MANQVYANMMEVSCKSAAGKSICAFPDVCFTPPQTPATPPGVPIPYPNTGMATDTTSGSTSVQISGKEVMLKNKSYFSKSMGDEAGCAPKKGVVTSVNRGKVYFNAWSMDVKIEGENVVRMMDITTHNHASVPGNTPTWPYLDEVATPGITEKCKADKDKAEGKCKDGADPCPGSLKKTVSEQRAGKTRKDGLSRTAQAGAEATADAQSSECVKAMRCALRPYKPDATKGGCCPGQTPHHIPPKSMMIGKVAGYNKDTALCVCMEGASQHVGSHGENHAAIDHVASKEGVLDSKGQCTVAQYNKVCADAVAAQCGCSSECIEAQLNSSFNDSQKNTKVKHWQSNSKQLSPETKTQIDNAYKAPKKVAKDK